MKMPGFTADTSLYKTKGHYQHEVTHPVGPRGNNEVLAQAQKLEGQQAAEDIQKQVGGAVHCAWVEYCEGRMPHQTCGAKKICYWWPV
jgi:hypothetical protein